MSGSRADGKMRRRNFVKLSGVAGATGILGMLGADRVLADAGPGGGAPAVDAPPHGGPPNGWPSGDWPSDGWPPDDGCRPPTPEPTPPPPPGGANCPAESFDCGYVNDTGPRVYLWEAVQVCEGQKPGPPFPSCLSTTLDYVIFNGGSGSDHDYLTVPSCRVKGIECPWIATPAAPNYWLAAWNNAQQGAPGYVHYPQIGLGINSIGDRMQDQLHIHMAGILSGIQGQLNSVDSTITNNPARWRNQFVRVVGRNAAGATDRRTYRALRVADLNTNLFTLLRDYIVRPNNTTMGEQMLVVTPRLTGSGGFYVLNSQALMPIRPPGYPGGTGTSDLLLVYA
ncbi:CDP-diacylglycerol diphosphatase [Plantactinospora siamensis]|uniref:CDP-diacylglycerol diphosphatase n=1 Tax=Plantactinospora siamensis TaxID=555372 RepID=A0ABV6P442_9ACTN